MLKSLRPPELPLPLLQAHLAASYGLSGSWLRLDGERDQNFKVTSGDGRNFVFKVCNPVDGSGMAECQAAALDHVAETDPSLPVPRLCRGRGGEALPSLTHEGAVLQTMVLTWLAGEPVGERRLTAKQALEIGVHLARLGRAMRGFSHAAPALRPLVWDLRAAADLADHIALLPAPDQGLAREILDRHRTVTVPLLRALRSQIIHGDVHPYNTLMTGEGAVSGLIDFGDMIHAPLVFDIANAVADFIFPGFDNAAIISGLIRGYGRVSRLEEAEVDVILDLADVRLVMTSLIFAMKQVNGIAATGFLEDFNVRVSPLLGELHGPRRGDFRQLIRRAAAYPPRRPAQAGQDAAGMVARRRRAMGDKLYVFYDPPLHMVRGVGVWLEAADGRRYLDCYNNVPQVGHCHPYVTEAIVRQARTLNTNTRYITDQSIDYAERLTALGDRGLSAVVFVNSGSEANDLAWRMAKAWAGRQGGLAMDFAYHGVTEAMDAFSPSNAPQSWKAPHIRLLPPPDDYRGPFKRGEARMAEQYAALADPLIEDLDRQGYGLAAAMIDSAFMSNGILDVPAGYLAAVVARVRAAGGVFIADEVQSGFGRMGTAFWGHQHHGVVPDFITIGKPAGNGHPVGAVITRPEILANFVKPGPFFSTFGGNNVACAAGLAVLDVIRDEQLIDNARRTGAHLRDGLKNLMARHALIGDVRGVGLAVGVELVRDRRTLEPAGEETVRLLNLIRDEGVLMGGEGKFGNVLKIRPPIVFARDDADLAIGALDRALSRL